MAVSGMMRRQFLGAGVAAALLVLLCARASEVRAASTLSPATGERGEGSRQPNLLLIMADDLGYGDVGYHGAQGKTPHLDRLATNSLRLEQHYVFPMCSPTRAALMTGRYASRFGCTGATNNRVLPFDTITLASALKSVGYETGIFGKWHLGSDPEWGPQKFGFDQSYGSLAGGVGPYDHRYKTGPFTQTWHRNGKLIEEEGHVTDLITKEAVKFIEAKRERPFFLYVPYTAVHIPIDEPKKWLDMNSHIEDPGSRLRAACGSHLDDGIGQILDALERTKVRDRTLVIFLSDNGAHGIIRNDDPQYPGKHPALKLGGSNVPLRGFKTQLYEGGVRTPAIVSWPGEIKPGKIDTPLHACDWMPTLCNLAGYKPPKDLKWDGKSILTVLEGKEPKPEPRTLYWLGVGRRSQALRHGDWKLIVPKDQPPELYDLATDPAESKNLADQHPERVKELKKRLEEQAARDDDAAVKEK